MRETVLMDHLSVGIKFPNGHEEKPMKDNNSFWLKTGVSSSFINVINQIILMKFVHLLSSLTNNYRKKIALWRYTYKARR